MARPEITSLTKLIIACENELGTAVAPARAPEPWKRLHPEIGKFKARAKKDPRLGRIDNLVLCLDYCLGHDIWPKTAVGITYVIDEALAAQQKEEWGKVDEHIGEAIAIERARGDLFSEDWISRLSRVQGRARHEVLASWRNARG